MAFPQGYYIKSGADGMRARTAKTALLPPVVAPGCLLPQERKQALLDEWAVQDTDTDEKGRRAENKTLRH
jgi:hypothetical protein